MKRWMTAVAGLLFVVTGSLVTSSALAASDPDDIMDDATEILGQFVDIPENKIPSALLRQAYGIAVIPSVLKIGFIGGINYGKGVLSVRTDKGHWSKPVFIKLYGGSFGFQAGVSSTDLVLVFKTRRSVRDLADGQFSLGGDAAVAAGPVGRRAGASTNLRFNAEVYSYSRSRGLFAGVAVNGGRIGIAQDANWQFYNKAGIDARTLLGQAGGSDLPQPGQRFVYTLNQYMPPSDNQFDYSSQLNKNNDSNGNGDNQGSTDTGYTGAGSRNSGGNGQGDDQGNGQTTPYNGGSGSGVTVQQNGNANNNAADTSDTSNYSGNYGNGAANDDHYGSSEQQRGQ